MSKIKLETAASLAHIQQPPMLISEILPESSITCVYAPTYSGKTFFALEAAKAIAFDLPFMGNWKIDAPGNVIFIEQDSPPYDTGRALYAMLKLHIKRLEAQIDGSHHLAALGLAWHPGLSLQKGEDCTEIARVAKNRFTSLGHHGPVERFYEGTKLIVMDTLRRLKGSADENDATQMGTIMNNLDWIREHSGGAAILFLHHSTKATFGVRGSSAIESEVDNIFRIARNKKTDIITCYIEKARAIQPLSFHYQIITEEHPIHGTLKKVEFAGLVEEPPEEEKPKVGKSALLNMLANKATPRADLVEWAGLNNVPKSTLYKWISTLKKEGKLTEKKGVLTP